MKRNDFLQDADVSGFLDFFSCCLSLLEVNYFTNFNQIHPKQRNFHVIGVSAAHASYAWPAVNTFSLPPYPTIYDWPSTFNFLQTARATLQNAIASNNDLATWDTVEKILEWGLSPKAKANNLNQLKRHCNGKSLSAYLKNIQMSLRLSGIDTKNITSTLIPYASSGMSKVHSLASTDGLIIFDSRVAATVGECINEHLRRNMCNVIPPKLLIYRESRYQRTPIPLIDGNNHPIFIRDYHWIECQVRVSWMFEEVLSRNPTIFPGQAMPARMHSLEAACFMMGAYLTPGPYAGRAFNFAKC